MNGAGYLLLETDCPLKADLLGAYLLCGEDVRCRAFCSLRDGLFAAMGFL